MSDAAVRLEFNYFWSDDPAIRGLPEELGRVGIAAETAKYMGFQLDYELAVHVLGWMEDHVLDALIAVLLAKLPWWSRIATKRGKDTQFVAPERHVRIYGPDGQVLRELTLEAEGPDHDARATEE